MSPLISRADSDARCASPRTSDATTAKPRPASPARAASTPAFSASRFVWNAISSMTVMMRLIWSEDASIFSMAWIASPTMLRPSSAIERLVRDTLSAVRARSAVECTLAVSSVSAAADSSSVAACVSARPARSWAAEVISSEPVRTWRATSTMRPIVVPRSDTTLLKLARSASYSWGKGSCAGLAICAVRSPAASRSNPVEMSVTMRACLRDCACASAAPASRRAAAAWRASWAWARPSRNCSRLRAIEPISSRIAVPGIGRS